MYKEYQPDKWVILKTYNDSGCFYRLLTSNNYLFSSGNSWSTNYGIVSCRKEGHYYIFEVYSGSIFLCHEYNYGFDDFGIKEYKGVLDDGSVEVMPFHCWTDFDFSNNKW